MSLRIPMIAATALGGLLAAGPVIAALSVYLAPEDLARRADVIVEARVVRSESGFDPLDGSLATYVTLDVSRVHRGPAELARVVVREPGGSHGGWVHDVDAVPVYEPGAEVLAFLESAPDGALRTSGMFLGKFDIVRHPNGPLEAVRELDGRGRILSAPPVAVERFALNDLRAVAARLRRAAHRRSPERRAPSAGPPSLAPVAPPAVQAASGAPTQPPRTWTAQPPELGRLVWSGARAAADSTEATHDPPLPRTEVELDVPGAGFGPLFVPISPTAPARWEATDAGQAIPIHVQRTGDPLGDPAAAVQQIVRALDAWTDVPESRVHLVAGDTNYDYTGTQTQSPAVAYSGINIVLFGDPYEDITDPVGCGGVLAIGGYWRSGSIGSTVNNVAFHSALQAYVVFNDGFECFLGDPDNLAEVATHEIGHSLGFGHSSAPDAIMRASAYGNRGPRLGDDDRDAAHCHYPHTMSIDQPVAGGVWQAGQLATIAWTSSIEAGPDPGTVDVELTVDGGASWTPLGPSTAHDGHHTVQAPQVVSSDARVRVVRHPRAGPHAAPYPAVCSVAISPAFSIASPPADAGSVPDGTSGPPLRLDRLPDGRVELSWGVSCSTDVDGHAIYEGGLSALRNGIWNPQPVDCPAGVSPISTVVPSAGDRFYLVAPLAGTTEGGLGVDSAGQSRAEPPASCGTRQTTPACS